MKQKMKNNENCYDADDAFAVTCGALRYALGRHSYAPSLVWNLIKRHWGDPAVARQRECIRKDISEFLENAEEDYASAVEAREKLISVRSILENMEKGCTSKYGRYPLRNVLDAIGKELDKHGCYVPDHPDLDIETTWRPALAWIEEHMNDNIENES